MGFDHNIQGYFEQLVDQGFAVMAFDLIGFGNRIAEGKQFYQRYPTWSKMGRMVRDVRGAIDALVNMEEIQSDQIYLSGFALGATVGLYTAALDERVKGLVAVSGFTPMRPTKTSSPPYVHDQGHLEIQELAIHHGLLPQLGLFLDHRSQLPYDYEDILTLMGQRPVLIIAPTWDNEVDLEALHVTIKTAKRRLADYGQHDAIELYTPIDYQRFSPEMKAHSIAWLYQQLNR